ncbi:MAG: hypothetical protein GY854_33255, partial [Deltaproteobacteria bacterium]|nr:hypothetical protein [Deltaproteobacteria bacterium]
RRIGGVVALVYQAGVGSSCTTSLGGIKWIRRDAEECAISLRVVVDRELADRRVQGGRVPEPGESRFRRPG